MLFCSALVGLEILPGNARQRNAVHKHNVTTQASTA